MKLNRYLFDMKPTDLNNLIEETIYREIKEKILLEGKEYEVYHIMCDGEPLATFNSEEEAKEQLPHYKDYVPKGKKLIIEKGIYESYSDMINHLDKLGEDLKEDKIEEVEETNTMKKIQKENQKLNEQVSEETQCDECGDKSLEELSSDDTLLDNTEDDNTSVSNTEDWEEIDQQILKLMSKRDDQKTLDGIDNSEEELNEMPKVCSECGGGLNEEGMCSECGMGLGMAESKKRVLRLKESELVGLISKMITEAMKGEPGAKGIPGLVYTKKAQNASKGDYNQQMKDTESKMKKYLTFDGNDNPEFPNEINKGEKSAYRNTEDQEAEIAKNKAGLQNLDYDIEPSDKFKERMKMAIEGDSKMGNGPTTGENTITPSNGPKAKDAKENTGNVINSKKSTKILNKQIKDRREDKEDRVLYDKQSVPVKNINESEETKKVINEDIQKMIKLSSYNKKTQ